MRKAPPLACLVVVLTAAAAASSEPAFRRVGPWRVYSVGPGQALPAARAALAPDHRPLRARAGWKTALVDFGYRLTAPVELDELPPRAARLLGSRREGEVGALAVAGEGVTEIRRAGSKPVLVRWRRGDAFVAPAGSWVGHANPYGAPARLLTWEVRLDGALLDPDRFGSGPRASDRYLADRAASGDEDGGLAAAGAGRPAAPAAESSSGGLVYRVGWGMAVPVGELATGPHLKDDRRGRGWRSAHVELGGRVINWLVVQDLPPGAEPFGHRHVPDAVFFALSGRGRSVFADGPRGPFEAVEWREGDVFALPWRAGGSWHAHSNPYGEPARLLASVHRLWGDRLLDPWIARVSKNYERDRAMDVDQRAESEPRPRGFLRRLWTRL